MVGVTHDPFNGNRVQCSVKFVFRNGSVSESDGAWETNSGPCPTGARLMRFDQLLRKHGQGPLDCVANQPVIPPSFNAMLLSTRLVRLHNPT